jgi:pimeloyl-ACP methyl ester carboxylesterase
MPVKLPSPVIVVPGVTANYLRDFYPLPPESIWAVMDSGKSYERSKMHPSNTRFEAQQPADIRPDQLYEVAYKDLIEALRYDLSASPDEPVPVYPFSYDWRQPLQLIEERLDAFIDEVIERTKLMRHYYKNGYAEAPKVNLIGHSMGGLVIAGHIERFGAAKLDKVASLASPFRGSFEAMVKLATGTANLGGSTPSSREREASRVTPSLYHLLPDFDTGVLTEKDADLPHSTFDPALFQSSILHTLVGYVDRYAVDRGSNAGKRKKQGEALFANLLGTAQAHRERIAGLDLAAKGLSPDRWLCVVGVDAKTRVRMTVEVKYGAPVFKLTSKDILNTWGDASADPTHTGDGTVHYLGAIPSFLGKENLVCVSPEDFGSWEVADKSMTKIAGFHGILPNMNMLHRLLVRYFTGSGDPRKNTWGRSAPGVSKADWAPAVQPLTWKAN